MKRLALVGTAPSHILTPWDDPEVYIIGLNDGYLVPGFKRADAWYDLHPLNKFHQAPEPPKGHKPVIFAHQVPEGHYVRPHNHLDWLATQNHPVWLHPDYATQHPAAATWPMARAFPKAEIEAHFGRYFSSSPQWMLAHVILQGYRDIEIYGIHLSTESEYIEQRPGFEYLIGRLLGIGPVSITIKDGLRRYETPDARVTLPMASPVLSASFQYGFEPSPRRKLDPLKWELHKAQVKRERMVTALKETPWWSPVTRLTEPIPNDPQGRTTSRWTTVKELQTQLWHYEALVADCQDQLARTEAGV